MSRRYEKPANPNKRKKDRKKGSGKKNSQIDRSHHNKYAGLSGKNDPKKYLGTGTDTPSTGFTIDDTLAPEQPEDAYVRQQMEASGRNGKNSVVYTSLHGADVKTPANYLELANVVGARTAKKTDSIDLVFQDRHNTALVGSFSAEGPLLAVRRAVMEQTGHIPIHTCEVEDLGLSVLVYNNLDPDVLPLSVRAGLKPEQVVNDLPAVHGGMLNSPRTQARPGKPLWGVVKYHLARLEQGFFRGEGAVQETAAALAAGPFTGTPKDYRVRTMALGKRKFYGGPRDSVDLVLHDPDTYHYVLVGCFDRWEARKIANRLDHTTGIRTVKAVQYDHGDLSFVYFTTGAFSNIPQSLIPGITEKDVVTDIPRGMHDGAQILEPRWDEAHDDLVYVAYYHLGRLQLGYFEDEGTMDTSENGNPIRSVNEARVEKPRPAFDRWSMR